MKRRWWILPILILLLVFLLIPRLVLIPSLSRELEEEFLQALQADEAELTIDAPWGWEVLLGQIPHLQLVMRGAELEGLELDWVELEGRGIRFEPWPLYRERELVLTDVSNLQGRIYITEQDLNKLFWEKVDPEQYLRLAVTPGGVVMSGVLPIWNLELNLSFTADLLVEGGSALRFVLKDVAVQDTRIPPLLLNVLSQTYDFIIDFGEFPYPLEITGIELLEQEIMVTVGGRQ